MGSDLDQILMNLSDRYEVTLRPFDARWEAVLTDYFPDGVTESGEKTYREVDRSPRSALLKVLKVTAL